MKIIGIIKEESLGDEIILVTDPPITRELIDFHNQRKGNHPDTSLATRHGKLIVTKHQYDLWKDSVPGSCGAEMLAAELARVQKDLDKLPADAQQARRIAEMKSFFGVPVKSASEFASNASPLA